LNVGWDVGVPYILEIIQQSVLESLKGIYTTNKKTTTQMKTRIVVYVVSA